MATLEERFWAKVDIDKPSACWNWKATRNNHGYGLIYAGRKNGNKDLASRVSYQINVGDIPDGKVVLHTCDNPACINPAHLRLGTMKDNYDDMVSKGRRKIVVNPNNRPPISYGSSHPRARFTFTEVGEIRGFLSLGVAASFIAKAMGVNKKIILNIKHGKTYAVGGTY